MNLTRKDTLLRYCGDRLSKRIEFMEVSDSEALVISRGVLFLMGFWSGPSVVGFKKICDFLSDASLPDDFIFRVLDLDGISGSILQTLSSHPVRIGGNAEAYWFREGLIHDVTTVRTATNEHIRQLLAAMV